MIDDTCAGCLFLQQEGNQRTMKQGIVPGVMTDVRQTDRLRKGCR